MAAIDPTGHPFASVGQENSPQYMEFVRRLAIEQSIREQAAKAQAATSYGFDVGSNPALSVPPQMATQPQPATAPQQMLQSLAVPPNAAATPAVQSVTNMPQIDPFPPQQQGPLPQAFDQSTPVPGMKGPVIDEADAQNRRKGWVSFIDKVKQDPNMQLALVRFATQMMQPLAPGQNALGQLGQSIQGSIDYLGANKAAQAQLEQTGAQTDLIKAQTTTEQGKPDVAAAGVEHTQAQTAQTQAQTARIKALTPKEEQQLDAQINKLKKDLGLTDQQIREVQADADLKSDPEYKQATIALLKAKAWHERNPAAVGSAQLQARKEFINFMSPYLLRTDPEILAETDATKQQDLAALKANDLWFAQGVKQRNVNEEAQAQYDLLKRQWEANPNDMTFDQYLNAWAGDIMHPSQNLPLIRAVVNHHDQQSGATPKQDKGKKDKRPPLSTYEK